jgi:hypothetical protein
MDALTGKSPEQPATAFRVLAIDGGGMRGLYTAHYLSLLAQNFAQRRGLAALDLGRAFDLIVGTSTGAIIGTALAAGIPPATIARFYQEHGNRIFPRKVPTSILGFLRDLASRPRHLKRGQRALRSALTDSFGEETLGALYARRGIALAIPAVELTLHRSWVFKTPHLPTSNHRDDEYSLVDICLASSAAPLFRSLATLERAGGERNTFADGGLWANTPVLIGLIDALAMTTPNTPVQVFSMGACPRPAGEAIRPGAEHRGYFGWRFGAEAAMLAIEAQEFAFLNMARLLAAHISQPCEIVRFPHDAVSADLAQYLDLDDTRPTAITTLLNLAGADADMTNSTCANPHDRAGQLICDLFNHAPAA